MAGRAWGEEEFPVSPVGTAGLSSRGPSAPEGQEAVFIPSRPPVLLFFPKLTLGILGVAVESVPSDSHLYGWNSMQ